MCGRSSKVRTRFTRNTMWEKKLYLKMITLIIIIIIIIILIIRSTYADQTHEMNWLLKYMNARSEMSNTHIQASFPSWTRLWLFPFLSSSVFSKQNARRVAVYSTLVQSPNFPLAQSILISSVLFSLYVNDMPIPSHHVQLARTTRPSATSCKPGLLVS